MAQVIPAFRSATRIYLDTSPFIYFIEEDPRFIGLVQPLIEAIDGGEKEGVSSFVTLLEILVKPLEEGRRDLAIRYRDLLLRSPGLTLMKVGESVAEEAARLRASYRFKIADAIQLAAAIRAGADLFVTNDTELRSFREIRVLVLTDHL